MKSFLIKLLFSFIAAAFIPLPLITSLLLPQCTSCMDDCTSVCNYGYPTQMLGPKTLDQIVLQATQSPERPTAPTPNVLIYAQSLLAYTLVAYVLISFAEVLIKKIRRNKV